MVRKDFDPHHGTSVYAVFFENGARMHDWTEVEPRQNRGRNSGTSYPGAGERD